jgi:outer membrane protein
MKIVTVSLIVFGLAGTLCAQGELLTLSEAYALALKNESKSRSAAFKAEASSEIVAQARSRLLPQMQYSYSVGKTEYEAQYNRLTIEEKYTYRQLSLSQPIYHPEYWSATSQAYAKKDASDLEFRRQSQTLGIDLAKTYFNYLKISKEEQLAKWQMGQYELKFRQIEKMLTVGLSNKIDMLESKIRFDKAKAEWITWQKQMNVAKFAIENMIGESIDGKQLIDTDAINPKTLPSDKSAWEQKLLTNVDVQLAETYLKVAKKEVDLRWYSHLPTVDARVSSTNTDTKDLSAHRYDKSFFIDVKIPIFQGGYTSSRVSEARLLLNAAREDLEATKKENRLRFEDLWSRRELSIDSVELFRESEKVATLYLESIEKAHKVGLKSIVDLLEAKAKLYTVKRDLLNSTYDFINNQMELLNISGELTIPKIQELESQVLLKN